MNKFLPVFLFLLSAFALAAAEPLPSGKSTAFEAEKKALEAERQRLANERRNIEVEKLRIQKEKQLLAIREVVTAHRSAVLAADLDKMLSICSKDYSENAWDGKTRSYDDLLKMVKYYSIVRSSSDLEEVMENALLIQGIAISDELREKASSIKKTSQAQQTISEIRSAFDAIFAKSSASAKFITVKNISINGNRASAVSEINEPGSKNRYPVKYELILHRGKWLVTSVK
jgi:hypothetical protein